MPVKVAVPAARAYEYYDPSRTGSGGATQLEASLPERGAIDAKVRYDNKLPVSQPVAPRKDVLSLGES